jgi:hypothetical protein
MTYVSWHFEHTECGQHDPISWLAASFYICGGAERERIQNFSRGQSLIASIQ